VDDDLWFCAEVIAPEGLRALAPLLREFSWPVEVRPSGYDGTDLLRASAGAVHIDMSAGQGTRKLFTGTVQADPQTALRLLGELSGAFRLSRMRHRIELYTAPDGPLLGYLHHDWPRAE
jgi:hypothetical protein